LNDRANELGAYLGKKLHALEASHPSIGEVRGIGLFWAVEAGEESAKQSARLTVGADKVAGRPLLVDKVSARMMGTASSCSPG